MRVRLLYFASFREAAGTQEEARELGDGSRLRDLWESVRRDVPFFRRFRSMPPAAINREYAEADTLLQDGDEVSFLPPVAGG